MFPNGDGSPYYSVAMEPSDNATAYVGNLRIYKTINSGLAWSQVFTPESAPYNYPMVGTYTNALTICPFDENIVNPKSLERIRSSLNVAETPEDKAEIEKVLQYLQNNVKEPSRIEKIINAIKQRINER